MNHFILTTSEYKSILLIRCMTGAIFLSEGIQKFLFPETIGPGRFLKIGIPYPDFFAAFVGVTEICCGVLLLLGLFTRVAALPLIIDMIVAIACTKIPLLKEKRFWTMAHEARTDYSMLLGCIFLLLHGGGRWSADSYLVKKGLGKKI